MLTQKKILDITNGILRRQGKPPVADDSVVLRDAGIRSLDFSELALRVEQEVGKELNFDVGSLRTIRTVKDMIDFFLELSGAGC